MKQLSFLDFSYFLGLLTATVSSEIFKAAQPALLYLVPFTLLPLLTMAYLKVSEILLPSKLCAFREGCFGYDVIFENLKET